MLSGVQNRGSQFNDLFRWHRQQLSLSSSLIFEHFSEAIVATFFLGKLIFRGNRNFFSKTETR